MRNTRTTALSATHCQIADIIDTPVHRILIRADATVDQQCGTAPRRHASADGILLDLSLLVAVLANA